MKLFKVAVVITALIFSQSALTAPKSTIRIREIKVEEGSATPSAPKEVRASKDSKTVKTPGAITLNPTTIQDQLLNNNISVLTSLNAVHQAKDEVNIARGNLFPSLNLGAMLSFSGGGFILSAIDFLLPFLLPSNWANYSSQKSLFEAEKLSYKVIQLNTYSSALSLYYTLLTDTQVQQIYQQEYQDLQSVYELLKRKSNAGTVPVSDLLQTQAQAHMAGVRASQLTELNKQEIASLRKSLALPLSTAITLEYLDAAASPWEFEAIDATIAQVNAVSVERTQLHYLVKAAKSQVWSKSFGWINGASIGSRSTGTGNANFANMNASGSINLGFALFPTIELSQHRVQEIQLQEVELYQENTRIIESAISSLFEAKQQLDLATQAENQMARVYQIRLQGYDQGTQSLIDVLLARTQMSEASIARVKANLDVNLQRTLLHRALITSEFSDIKGCSANARMPVAKKEQSRIGKIFKPRPAPVYPSFDDVCRAR